MTRSKFSLTTARAVDIFEEMITCRRDFRADNSYFLVSDLWEHLCDEQGLWRIKTFRSNEREDFKRKAGVVALNGRVTLTLDERLFANAKTGCKLSNFILAHELGHVALDHHAKGAVTKHFQLFCGSSGLANVPPTLEELEANYAAVFLQCGIALADPRISALELAHRACTDVYYVRKAQRIVQLSVFQTLLQRLKPNYEKLVL